MWGRTVLSRLVANFRQIPHGRTARIEASAIIATYSLVNACVAEYRQVITSASAPENQMLGLTWWFRSDRQAARGSECATAEQSKEALACRLQVELDLLDRVPI